MFCCFCFVLNSVLSPASAAEYQLHHLYPDHCERLHLRGGPGAGHGRDHVHLPLHVWRVYLPTVHHWSEVTDREMVCFYMVGSGSFKYMIATEAPNSVFTTLLLTIQPLPTPHLQLCRTGIRILTSGNEASESQVWRLLEYFKNSFNMKPYCTTRSCLDPL